MIGELILNHLENNVPVDGRWYLNLSKFWYLTEEQAKGFINMSSDKKYSSDVHGNEFSLLEKHKEEIVSKWSKDIAVVDFGCGTAEKTLVKIREAFRQGKDPFFHLVDINPFFLGTAIKNSKKAGIIPKAHLDLIENMPNLLKEIRKQSDSIYINLGINHANFEKSFMNTVYNSMSKRDFLYVNTQIRTKENEQKILKGYKSEKARRFIFLPLKMIGFKEKQLDFDVRYNGEELELFFTVKEVPFHLKYLGLKQGDELIVGTSRKPTLKQFNKQFSKFKCKKYFNESKDFLIAICRK